MSRGSGLGKAAVVFVTIYSLVAAGMATLEYIDGRIILVDTGLNAPDWWAWFWFNVLVFLPIYIWFSMAGRKSARDGWGI